VEAFGGLGLWRDRKTICLEHAPSLSERSRALEAIVSEAGDPIAPLQLDRKMLRAMPEPPGAGHGYGRDGPVITRALVR
jgi:hypothetical protein